MPALVADIHVFLYSGIKDVDGQDKPAVTQASVHRPIGAEGWLGRIAAHLHRLLPLR
jgi:hypothetical protein